MPQVSLAEGLRRPVEMILLDQAGADVMSAAFIVGQTLLAFAAAVAGVAVFRRWAQSRRLLDVPNERSSRQVPTPRGAGLVVVAVSAAALMADSWFGQEYAGGIVRSRRRHRCTVHRRHQPD